MDKKKQQENPFVNIIVNIVLPVMILKNADKIDHPQSALIALIVGLALPIGYGMWDYIKNNRKNYIALFGVINVGFTGGFALMQLSGDWFAVKEALFPLLIGLVVLGLQYIGKPIFVVMLKSSGAFKWEFIEQKAIENGHKNDLNILLRNSNIFFAASFFISSVLNLILAKYIFIPINQTLSDADKQQILNDQIGEMTWMGFVVIAFPLMIFMGLILWYFLNGVKKYTGLQLEDFAGDSETTVSS